jgi:hypothetical protein
MRKLLLAASAVALLSTCAHALDLSPDLKIGSVISFREPLIGCSFYGDAREFARLTWAHDYWGYARLAQRLVADSVSTPSDGSKPRYCHWLVDDAWVDYTVVDAATDHRWPINQREIDPPRPVRPDTTRSNFFCVVTKEDAIKAGIENAKYFCAWVWLQGGVQ